MQTLALVERRWAALMAGEKTDTIRLNEGVVEPGLLIYEIDPSKTERTVVWVTEVMHIPLREVALFRDTSEQALLDSMRRHYPKISLDTEVMFVKHLTPTQTAERYPTEVVALGL